MPGLYCIPTTPPTAQLRCGCLTNSTVFDEYQGRCVGKVGHPCVYSGNQSFCPDKAHCSHQDPHHPDLYFYESRCFCDVSYFGDKQGKCILAAKFGESCSASVKKCDEVSGLKCVDGKCACAFGKDQQYYDGKKDKCVSHIGKNCTGFNSCSENARCEGSSVNRAIVGDGNEKLRARRQIPPPTVIGRSIPGNLPPPGRFINRNSINVPPKSNSNNAKKDVFSDIIGVGTCVCNYGFTATKGGKCLGSYRQSCSRVQRCNHEDNLECLDGSCNCKSPLHQNYDHLIKKCLSLVGAKCDSGRNSANSCVDNAHCVSGSCICKDGWVATPFRRCMLGYGKPCENMECNSFNGLTCKNSNSPNNTVNNSNSGIKSGKRCSCVDDSLVYNGQMQSCVSQLGSPCGKIGQENYGKESFYVACEPPAICREEPGGDKSSRFCRLPN
ncbi:Tenascin-X [Folsomia candida]|uniref:Tenascin-X n=1 Tax=Folsomia candida TaxID=158441 RepID=A0A226DZ95_FOLCA|nr:Tenascin-X [Folsomia candida]